MSKKSKTIEAMRQKKAQLLEQAAELDRDMAVLAELSAKYDLVIAGADDGEAPKTRRLTRSAKFRTLDALIESYKNSTEYKSKRFNTRVYYGNLFKKFEPYRSYKLKEITAKDFQSFYDDWTNDGKERLTVGRAGITMLRVLVHYGASELSDSECERLSVILHNMRFAVPKSRSRPLSLDHAKAIIRMAHKMDMPSIALAQAFQFEVKKLRQKDVIGEWVPINELTPPTEIIDGDRKWLRGLRWQEIDEDLVLRHPSSGSDEIIEFPLRTAPLVVQELSGFNSFPKSGPIIVSDRKGVPWHAQAFRKAWRRVANAAGVPKEVQNMDSRTHEEQKNERPADADSQSTGR